MVVRGSLKNTVPHIEERWAAVFISPSLTYSIARWFPAPPDAL